MGVPSLSSLSSLDIYEDYNRAQKVNRQLAITSISHNTVAFFQSGTLLRLGLLYYIHVFC